MDAFGGRHQAIMTVASHSHKAQQRLCSVSSRNRKQYYCRKCKGHGISISVKGHKRKCNFKDCNCSKCELVEHGRHIVAKQISNYRKQRSEDMQAERQRLLSEGRLLPLPPPQQQQHQQHHHHQQQQQQQQHQQSTGISSVRLELKKLEASVLLGKDNAPHCRRCRNHGVIRMWKGHKKRCPHAQCICDDCSLIALRKSNDKSLREENQQHQHQQAHQHQQQQHLAASSISSARSSGSHHQQQQHQQLHSQQYSHRLDQLPEYKLDQDPFAAAVITAGHFGAFSHLHHHTGHYQGRHSLGGRRSQRPVVPVAPFSQPLSGSHASSHQAQLEPHEASTAAAAAAAAASVAVTGTALKPDPAGTGNEGEADAPGDSVHPIKGACSSHEFPQLSTVGCVSSASGVFGHCGNDNQSGVGADGSGLDSLYQKTPHSACWPLTDPYSGCSSVYGYQSHYNYFAPSIPKLEHQYYAASQYLPSSITGDIAPHPGNLWTGNF